MKPEKLKCMLCGIKNTDLIRIRGKNICTECKPIHVQRLKEGSFGQKRPKRKRPRKRTEGVPVGIVIGLALQVIAGVVWFIWAESGVRVWFPILVLVFWGAVQLIYMIPAIFISAVFRKKGIAIGLAIIMFTIIILNASLWGLLFLSSKL